MFVMFHICDLLYWTRAKSSLNTMRGDMCAFKYKVFGTKNN